MNIYIMVHTDVKPKQCRDTNIGKTSTVFSKKQQFLIATKKKSDYKRCKAYDLNCHCKIVCEVNLIGGTVGRTEIDCQRGTGTREGNT